MGRLRPAHIYTVGIIYTNVQNGVYMGRLRPAHIYHSYFTRAGIVLGKTGELRYGNQETYYVLAQGCKNVML
jgi:hypothetical protein